MIFTLFPHFPDFSTTRRSTSYTEKNERKYSKFLEIIIKRPVCRESRSRHSNFSTYCDNLVEQSNDLFNNVWTRLAVFFLGENCTFNSNARENMEILPSCSFLYAEIDDKTTCWMAEMLFGWWREEKYWIFIGAQNKASCRADHDKISLKTTHTLTDDPSTIRNEFFISTKNFFDATRPMMGLSHYATPQLSRERPKNMRNHL